MPKDGLDQAIAIIDRKNKSLIEAYLDMGDWLGNYFTRHPDGSLAKLDDALRKKGVFEKSFIAVSHRFRQAFTKAQRAKLRNCPNTTIRWARWVATLPDEERAKHMADLTPSKKRQWFKVPDYYEKRTSSLPPDNITETQHRGQKRQTGVKIVLDMPYICNDCPEKTTMYLEDVFMSVCSQILVRHPFINGELKEAMINAANRAGKIGR